MKLRSQLKSLLHPLGGVPRDGKMRNEGMMGRGEPIFSREGDVIMCAPLGFPSFPRHAGKSMEVKGCGNGGIEMVRGRAGEGTSGNT